MGLEGPERILHGAKETKGRAEPRYGEAKKWDRSQHPAPPPQPRGGQRKGVWGRTSYVICKMEMHGPLEGDGCLDPCPPAAVSHCHKLGGLKQQPLILSPVRRPETPMPRGQGG